MKRSVLITGAGGGLGRALVARLSEHGWKVFAADIDEGTIPRGEVDEVVPLTVDVTNADSVEQGVAAIARQTRQLDAVVNFAGVMGLGSLTDIPEERLGRILDINVLGTYRVNKACRPLLVEARGRIVNISSETGWQTTAPFNGPYAMSKYAIEAYSHALRREMALLGVKVITVQPGPFKTDMVRGIEPAFTLAEAETPRFATVLRKLKSLASKQINTANDPEVLAEAIERALNVKRPKAVYSVRPDRMRSTLDRLPLRAQDQVYLALLRRADKDA
ncbi:MAG: SDR family NAD(P)-dependent oxidoreductase [Myxococcota bacterium]